MAAPLAASAEEALLYEYERGLDGLSEGDLVVEAEVEALVRETVAQAVGDSAYAPARVDAWSAAVLEGCLKKLSALGKPYKYVVTCGLGQRAGAGLHAASCARWNPRTDGTAAVLWHNDAVQGLVSVHWVAP